MSSSSSEDTYYNLDGEYEIEGEIYTEVEKKEKTPEPKTISVGDFLPYGPRMYYESPDNVVRIKDIGEKSRILVIGVIGSFTPDCWNRHLFLVLQKLDYFQERGVDYICCIATNDPFAHQAWGTYLGCEDTVLMWGDPTKRFTKALGMDIVVPWLDNNIRSKRYIILADNMLVTKILKAPQDDLGMTWQCEHFTDFFSIDEEENDDLD